MTKPLRPLAVGLATAAIACSLSPTALAQTPRAIIQGLQENPRSNSPVPPAQPGR
ncbi:MAG: hypothetical protein KME14_06200 [Tildeniella torsiva UHER 1998/13D]|nr:hypothetical protein [Tildeniella torsiva UHER 1998/13D]